jgi:hypothetical protein
MKVLCSAGLFVALVLFVSTSAIAQVNYDEAKVPKYTLPDPLVLVSGERVKDAKTWQTKRRPEIMRLFETQMYGRTPTEAAKLSFDVTSVDSKALGGLAIRKEVTIKATGPSGKTATFDLLIYLPAKAKKPVPTFVGLNFRGNHTIHSDPAIKITKAWLRRGDKEVNNRTTAKDRGKSAGRWQVEKIVAHGYGIATIYCGDIDPDFHDGFKNGVHPLFYKKGQTKPAPDEWVSIGAWAWGLSRALDYFKTDKQIDHKHVAVIGHSRLGKTSLWAGAQDERFALVISNNSGCGGAALSKRAFGETLKIINRAFPHWFCGNFKKYNGNESALPLDQHMLITLMAPRPVYIASAQQDRWADPHGEFLSGLHASPVYRLLGKSGMPIDKMPAVNTPVHGTIGYHVRTGKHNVTEYDWMQYLKFADKHFGRAAAK